MIHNLMDDSAHCGIVGIRFKAIPFCLYKVFFPGLANNLSISKLSSFVSNF